MRLIIIRHGESEADLLNVHEGCADFNLTENGHIQAMAMSNWIQSHYNVNKIYCSPLKRAYQTATHLSQALNLPLNVDIMLMEYNNGLIAGLTTEEANVKYALVSNLPLHSSINEQESKLEFRFRADYILSKIISENNESDTIAIVSHGGFINQLFLSFIKAPIDSDIFYSTGDTGIHEWIIDNNSRRIVFSNSLLHTL